MLRHFKMELKRQQEQLQRQQTLDNHMNTQQQQHQQMIISQENSRPKEHSLAAFGGGSSMNLLAVARSVQHQDQWSMATTTKTKTTTTNTDNQRRRHDKTSDPARLINCHQPMIKPIIIKRNRQLANTGATMMINRQDNDGERCLPTAKRVRGRRSSKPLMEKRRRARINECLDILKSYVLNDSSNLSRLGIDLKTANSDSNENQLQDEELIAREILKSSGLINRHKGRKNPNKLEKADILELTVDYVRRLHEQRDELISIGQNQTNDNTQVFNHNQQQRSSLNPAFVFRGATNYLTGISNDSIIRQQQQPTENHQFKTIPANLNMPLTLDLSPKSRLSTQQTPITPPPSSASTSPNEDQVKLVIQARNNQLADSYAASLAIWL